MKLQDWIAVGTFSAAFVCYGLWLRAKRRAEAHAREAERRDDTHDKSVDEPAEAPIDLPADEPLPEWPWHLTRIAIVLIAFAIGVAGAYLLMWLLKL